MTLLTAAIAASVLRAVEACCSRHCEETGNRPTMTSATVGRHSPLVFARGFCFFVGGNDSAIRREKR